jgi:glycerol-3-phosphate dehydrogenase
VRARSLDDDGATVVDRNGGEAFRIRARSVINAAGAWAGELAPTPPTRIHRRTQLVIDADAAGLAETAVSFPRSRDRENFLTLTPEQEGHARLGTVETPVDGPIADIVENAEIGQNSELAQSTVDQMLDSAKRALNRPLERRDVRRVLTELRPLVDSGSKVDAKALLRPTRTPPPGRGHALRTAGNVVTIAGGTLGTYRRVAADAVDAAIRAKDLATGPSRTAAVPLVGAVERARAADLDVDPWLVAKYGAEAVRVSALAELDADLAEEVAPSLSAAEVVWAVRHENALNADDVLDRRSRSGLDPERREAARPAVAELVARALRGVLS